MIKPKKLPTVLSLKLAAAPRWGVRIYGVVQSQSRGTRLNHSVVFRQIGRRKTWACSCERHVFRADRCDHIKAMQEELKIRAKSASTKSSIAKRLYKVAA